MTKRIAVIFMGMMLSPLGAEEEAQTIINQAEQASQFGSLDAKALIQSLTDGHKKSTEKMSPKACRETHSDQAIGRCGMSLSSQKDKKLFAQLFIFVSASMPQQSLINLGREAQKIGAHVVFRGLVGGTFPKTQSYMKDLGITAEIDPPKFEDYKIAVVPTFVLVNTNVSDRVAGHISLFEALDQFRKKGDLKTEAQKLYLSLKTIRGES
jgi:type-F conjugative transfer system pilin assembly protein TrbC